MILLLRTWRLDCGIAIDLWFEVNGFWMLKSITCFHLFGICNRVLEKSVTD